MVNLIKEGEMTLAMHFQRYNSIQSRANPSCILPSCILPSCILPNCIILESTMYQTFMMSIVITAFYQYFTALHRKQMSELEGGAYIARLLSFRDVWYSTYGFHLLHPMFIALAERKERKGFD